RPEDPAAAHGGGHHLHGVVLPHHAGGQAVPQGGQVRGVVGVHAHRHTGGPGHDRGDLLGVHGGQVGARGGDDAGGEVLVDHGEVRRRLVVLPGHRVRDPGAGGGPLGVQVPHGGRG